MPIDNSVALQIKGANSATPQTPDALTTLGKIQQLQNQQKLSQVLSQRSPQPSAFPAASPQAFPDPSEGGPG